MSTTKKVLFQEDLHPDFFTCVDDGGVNKLAPTTPPVASNTSVITNTVSGNRIATHDNGTGLLTDIDETVTTATNTIAGNRIATYTNEAGAAVDIDETITTLVDTGVNAASGADILRYTNESGGLSDFCEGFSSVEVNNGCGNDGVGTNKVIKRVAIVNKQLQVDAVPDHTSQNAALNAGSTTNVNLGTAPWTTIYTTPNMVFTNPSPCRSMDLIFLANYYVELRLSADTNARFLGQVSINGGGTWVGALDLFEGPYDTASNRADISSYHYVNNPIAFTLPPGGTYNFRARLLGFKGLANNAATARNYTIGMRVLGSTV